ncbi:hypothetical protein Q9189_006095 [Teloschistes chrysophthalmus]
MGAMKVLTANMSKKRRTHFLRIPLTTAISTPQLQKSLQQVAEDPLTANLPPVAWSSPDQVHLSFESSVLDTPARLRKAEQILHNINMKVLVNDGMAHPSSLPKQHDSLPQPVTKALPANAEELHSIQTPTVSLHGPTSKVGMSGIDRALRLKMNVQEPRPFLLEFRRRIRNLFMVEGLMPEDAPIGAQLNPLMPSLLSTLRLRTVTIKFASRVGRPIIGSARYRRPVFGASNIFPKYANFPWTANFPLERLCISETGLKGEGELKEKMSDGEEPTSPIPVADPEAGDNASGDNAPDSGAGAPASGGQMNLLDALKGVLKLALIHDGLARGLREASKALDRRQAHMCVLNENCEEEAYKKLVVALCGEHGIPLIKVPDGKALGEWAGLCVLDREGNARKVVNCSCVVVRDWGEESQERSILLNYFQTEQ